MAKKPGQTPSDAVEHAGDNLDQLAAEASALERMDSLPADDENEDTAFDDTGEREDDAAQDIEDGAEPEDTDEESDSGGEEDDATTDESIPEKYRGKTPAELIRMHQEAERMLGTPEAIEQRRQAQKPAQPSPEEMEQRRQQRDQARLKELADDIYTELVEEGAEPYSEDAPETWNLAVKRAGRELKRLDRIAGEIAEEKLAPYRDLIERTAAPGVFEEAARGVIRPGDPVMPKHIADRLRARFPKMSAASFQGFPEDISLPMLELARSEAILLARTGREKQQKRDGTSERETSRRPRTVDSDSGSGSSGVVISASRMERKVAELQQRFAGQGLSEAQIKELAKDDLGYRQELKGGRRG